MKARKRGRTPIEEAVSMIVEETKGPIETELRALADSAGYVLAGDVRAVLDQPPFTRSPPVSYTHLDVYKRQLERRGAHL